MNGYIPEIIKSCDELLNTGGFDYAFCGGHAIDIHLNGKTREHGDIDVCAFEQDRDKIIRFMQSRGYTVYEPVGNGLIHLITDTDNQMLKKLNIFCVKEGCTFFHIMPHKDDVFYCEIEHTEQTNLDFIELLFNKRTENKFIYSRNSEITLDIGKAILRKNGVKYFAPELVLLYKSTDLSREENRLDFESALPTLTDENRRWLANALEKAFPDGHEWLTKLARKKQRMIDDKTKKLILREENEFPKLFTSFEARDYGILYYNTDERNSYDSNHTVIFPERITDLGAVLEDIKRFYAELGYNTAIIYHPFAPEYFTDNRSVFDKHGFSLHTEEKHRVMLLREDNMLPRCNRLRIERLSVWDERILTDILSPDSREYEQSVLKNSLKNQKIYLFVGYIGSKAAVEVNFHTSALGCTRFDHIVTAPDERGKGYGREIVRFVTDFCHTNSFPLCYQWPDNLTSERITMQAGFRHAFDLESGYAVCKLHNQINSIMI